MSETIAEAHPSAFGCMVLSCTGIGFGWLHGQDTQARPGESLHHIGQAARKCTCE